ncbi:hypothetical protein RYH80_02940 [Halobaculum sp. MBLA0147]|uniref:hypothetical protein n=1 Tax=Halobaculum sp. MBLA0147 TaxID=3079934 RepID=UPI003526AC9F
MVRVLHVLAYVALAAVSLVAWLYNDRRTDDGRWSVDRRGLLAVLLGNAVFIFGSQFLLRRWGSLAEFAVAVVLTFAAVGWHYYGRRTDSASGV